MDIAEFNTIIRNILNSHGEDDSLCSFDINSHFTTGASVKKTNAAFLVMLAGTEHPFHTDAETYLAECDDEYAEFLQDALALMQGELKDVMSSSSTFSNAMTEAAYYLSERSPLKWNNETSRAVWQVFFPEGVSCIENRSDGISALRERRTVNITQLNGNPLSAPAKELLFTSNILLTIPASEQGLEQAGLPDNLTERIREVSSENQLFWFDHPIQIGVETDKNEVIYGLRGLNDTLAFEKGCGNMGKDDKATCVLSVSVTHRGLHNVTKEYLDAELGKIEDLENLNIYIFTESETKRLISDVLAPAAKTLLPDADTSILLRVFGVDGEYGRHYSFLKAISAFWHVLIAPEIRATFKIDLDQVFPQKVLMETTGMSAFEHYMNPLWGATGRDSSGRNVELGMIAGALVNENDIDKGLYTADVTFPESIKNNESVFFMSGLPMALSTEAEMGTRYSENAIDGKTSCIQRVHVTGGTNGILVDSLRKYRPFTPSFIGRAEDQAYLMSALFSTDNMNLRYFHRDGLIMRHDKHAFAGEAIEAAQVGRQIGDLVRILYFSSYARCLPWDIEKTKCALDPFTGCFISKIPVTVVMMRLAVSMAEMCESDEAQVEELAAIAAQRLGEALANMDLTDDYNDERAAWNLYYDILDALENAGSEADGIRAKAKAIVADCKTGD